MPPCWADTASLAAPQASVPLTFVVEDSLHLHTTAGVGDAQRAAGHKAFCCGGPVSGAYQTPVRLVMRPLQNLHRLTTPNGQLVAVASREVMDHYRQLTATRELRGTEKEGQVSKENHWAWQGWGHG